MSAAAAPARAAEHAPSRTARRALAGGLPGAAHAAVLATALTLWTWALAATDASGVAGRGLLDVLPASFYVALGLVCAGFALAACERRVRPAVLIAYTLALIAILHLTSPILFALPRYVWAYKHFGPVELIASAGRLHPSVDIYNNWPGFFALNAWLKDALHLSPLTYGRWAEPLFAVAGYAATVFALRGFSADPRRFLVAGWIFVVADWTGQDYFAPQALAFVLAMAVLGLAVRSDRPAGRATPVLLWLCWAALVTTHQLTPIVVIGWLFALAVLRRGVRLWVVGVMAATEVAMIVHSWSWLSLHATLFAPELFATARPPGFNGELALAGVAMARDARVTIGLLVMALAVVGALRRRAEGRQDLALLVLPVVPVVVALIQRYGGDGPERAYLFALPFAALLGADACFPRGVVRRGRLLVAALLLGAAAPMAFFALELTYRVRPEDVRVAQWVEANAAPRAALVYLNSEYVQNVTARYPRLAASTIVSMGEERRYQRGLWGRWTVSALDAQLRSLGERNAYVIATPGQAEYARMYGLEPRGSAAALTWALERDSRFDVVHRDGPAVVFRWSGHG